MPDDQYKHCRCPKSVHVIMCTYHDWFPSVRNNTGSTSPAAAAGSASGRP